MFAGEAGISVAGAPWTRGMNRAWEAQVAGVSQPGSAQKPTPGRGCGTGATASAQPRPLLPRHWPPEPGPATAASSLSCTWERQPSP